MHISFKKYNTEVHWLEYSLCRAFLNSRESELLQPEPGGEPGRARKGCDISSGGQVTFKE
jgi:hypothetical protein